MKNLIKQTLSFSLMGFAACTLVILFSNAAWAQDATYQAKAAGAFSTNNAVYWAFRILGILTVLGAVATVTRRNPVVATVCLVATLFCTGGLYLLLHAPFLAAIQVLVYAGAIMVLFIFVVMAVDQPDREEFGFGRGMVSKILGIVAITMLVVPLIKVLLGENFSVITKVPTTFGSVTDVGKLLFSDYLLPFEAISFLLLVAIVGAVAVTRRRKSARDGGGQ